MVMLYVFVVRAYWALNHNEKNLLLKKGGRLSRGNILFKMIRIPLSLNLSLYGEDDDSLEFKKIKGSV